MARLPEQHVLPAVDDRYGRETTVRPRGAGRHIGAGTPSGDAFPDNAPARLHRRYAGAPA